MSFLDAGKSRDGWVSSLPLRTSVCTERACVQCGSRLDPVGFEKFDFSGKCFNCSEWISEDDELFEDL